MEYLPETLKIVAESIPRLGTQILIAHRCYLGDSIRMFFVFVLFAFSFELWLTVYMIK